jgi:choline dehydrogenase-like flavoprotein
MTTAGVPTSGTITSLPPNVNTYDYIIVGGGTAGCVIADRLSQYLPEARVLVIEAGPSDYQDDRVLLLKDWLKLLGGDLDYDYGIVEQPRGNSHIRHSRAKVLGGCSSHNTLISFAPFRLDMERWERSHGCKGWTFEMMQRMISKLKNTIQPVHENHRNQLCLDWVQSCSDAMQVPVHHDFNAEIGKAGQLSGGVGFFSVAYNPDDGRRSSASVA